MPRMQRLKKHYAKMEPDIFYIMADDEQHYTMWLKFSELHKRARLLHTIEGVTLSGAIDVQIIDTNDVTIIDYNL